MDWLSIPGLFKYLTFLALVAYAYQWVKPDIGSLLSFDRGKVLSGEAWRILTFIFAPEGLASFSVWPILLLVFAAQMSMTMSDSLDDIWGSARVTHYLLVGWVCMLACHFAFPGAGGGGMILYASMFFAYATLFPKEEILLFMVLPVQVRFLGLAIGVGLLIVTMSNPAMLLSTLPALIPYGLWVLPDVIHGRKSLVKAAQRRQKFRVSKLPESVPFHVCEVCHRTERDPADLQFFVMPDGKEYCSEHLPAQK